MDHLIFYDGSCGFCDRIVRFVYSRDKHKRFIFAPLQGETAKKLLKDLPEKDKQEDSLVLIENYKGHDRKFYILGKAGFRVLWQLGGLYALPGSISFLPSFLYDWGYRLIARNRHRLFSADSCRVPTGGDKERFLP